jgi:hypothetical protein
MRFKSIIDLLQEVLELIVPPRPPVVDAAVYQVVAERLHSLPDRKTPLQLLDCVLPLLEAPHALPVATVHHLHQSYYTLLVLQYSHKSLVEQTPKLEELLRVQPSNHLDILGDKLERALLLQLHTLSRRIREEETKVNVNYIPFPVQ